VDYKVAPGSITTVDVNTDAAALHAQALGGTFVVASGGAQDSFVATNVANSVDGRSYTGTQGSLPGL
jgi:Flp pilus assembly CpaE family ATPase